MRWYKILARILPMVSTIYFALAAPVAVQKPAVRVSGVDDGTTTSQPANAADSGRINAVPILGSLDSGPWLELEKRQHNPIDLNDSPGPSKPLPPWNLNLPPPSPTSPPLSQSSTHDDLDLNSSPSQLQGATDDSHELNPLSPNDHINLNSPPPPNSGSTVDVLPQAHPDPLASSSAINSLFDAPTQANPDPSGASSSAHGVIHPPSPSLSSESTSGLAHDIPPQADPDPLASPTEKDKYIDSLFHYSPNSEPAPWSPHDAPTQTNPDPLAASSSAQGVIHPPSTSSLSFDSISGLAHNTPPQADPDPLASPTAQDRYIDSLFHYSPNSEPALWSLHDAPTQANPDPLAASSSAHGVIHPPSTSSPSLDLTSGLAHDTPPQAHPDSVAGLPAQNIMDLASPSSTSSESAPGSPLDTPLQTHQDSVAVSSAQNLIDIVSSSSESIPGSPLDIHPQAHSDPLTPSSAHGITYSDLPRPAPPSDPAPHPLLSAQAPDEDSAMANLENLLKTPFLSTEEYHSLSLGPTNNHYPPASPSNPRLSTGPGLPLAPLIQPSGEDSSIADLEHPPLAVLQNPGSPTGLHTLSSAQSPDEDPSVVDLDTLLKNPFLSTEEYYPLSLGTTDDHHPASPSNPSSTGPHSPPLAQPSVEDSSTVNLEHPPPVVPPNPGSSTGLHSLPGAQSPDEDPSMTDLDTLLKTPFLLTEEYHPLSLGTTNNQDPPASPSSPGPSTGPHPPPLAQSSVEDSSMVNLEHPPPVVPPNPGSSTGLHGLPSAQSPDGDISMTDLDTLLKTPFLLTEEYHPLSLGTTNNHDLPASPSNPGPSTGPHPPPLAQSSVEDSSMVNLEHPPPVVPPSPGLSTGLHGLPSAQSPDGDISMTDLDTLLKTPFLLTEENHPLSLGTTNNHDLPASPSSPGPSTGPHPPPLAQSSVEDSSMVNLEHPPPVVPPNPGSSTGLHSLPGAQSPDEDPSMTDLDTLLKTPFLSAEEYYPLNLGTTDDHHPPASLSNPGTSTGLHPLPSAESQNGNSGSADLERPTDNPPQASPPNLGPSTEPNPPPNAKRPRPEDHDWHFLSKILKGGVKRHFPDSSAVQGSLQDAGCL